MEALIKNSKILVNSVSLKFKRSLYNDFPWEQKLTGIVGGRGVGKTTLILQYLKENYANADEAIYISLDNLYFSKTSLLEFTDNFYRISQQRLLPLCYRRPHGLLSTNKQCDQHCN